MAEADRPSPAATVARPDAEFYVGYFKMPPGLAGFLRLLVPTALLLSAALAVLLARSQNNPGDGRWDDATAQTFVGFVEATPYPLIRVPGATPERPIETLLLVEVGKFGGGRRALPLNGRSASVSGWIVERDGRRLLEMEPGDSLRTDKSISDDEQAALRSPPEIALGRATLRGEIIDSKCYLGVMKPGEGRTHKECATLCIAGGIPPMFVTTDAAGRRTYYLLTDPTGRALDSRVLPFVADPVIISGQLAKQADLLFFKIEPADIQRL